MPRVVLYAKQGTDVTIFSFEHFRVLTTPKFFTRDRVLSHHDEKELLKERRQEAKKKSEPEAQSATPNYDHSGGQEGRCQFTTVEDAASASEK